MKTANAIIQFFKNSYINAEKTFLDEGVCPCIKVRLSFGFFTKMKEYVKKVKNVQEMKCLLKLYVRNDLFTNCDFPDMRNRQLFPTISTISANIVSKRRKM